MQERFDGRRPWDSDSDLRINVASSELSEPTNNRRRIEPKLSDQLNLVALTDKRRDVDQAVLANLLRLNQARSA